jgi:hypothetical protein
MVLSGVAAPHITNDVRSGGIREKDRAIFPTLSSDYLNNSSFKVDISNGQVTKLCGA